MLPAFKALGSADDNKKDLKKKKAICHHEITSSNYQKHSTNKVHL